jgi:predicted AAA+ superfamily ATPase
MLLKRDMQASAKELLKNFKALAIIGPRQSGKSTLAKMLAPRKAYVSFENPDTRFLFESDPRGFLSAYTSGAIFDEAQYVPKLFNYLQQILDESPVNGRFILTGSNNFLLVEKISQSLAGRIIYTDLLPFSIKEISRIKDFDNSAENLIFHGGYPGIVYEGRKRLPWFQSYVRNYIERDVRLLKNISNYSLFQKFISLCAGRIGQQLNLTNLGNECGLDHKTIQSWIGVLEASFIIHLLPPYYKNFNKRIIKTPKLYFYDTGLACYLLGIQQKEQLQLHPFRGALFENMIVAEMLKSRYNKGLRSNLYYFRDNTGNEIDILIDNGKKIIPVEIKSAQSVAPGFFKNLDFWEKLTGTKEGYIVYGGIESNSSRLKKIISWRDAGKL